MQIIPAEWSGQNSLVSSQEKRDQRGREVEERPEAKAETGHSSVSLELLMRAILATGSTPQEIGEVLERV